MLTRRTKVLLGATAFAAALLSSGVVILATVGSDPAKSNPDHEPVPESATGTPEPPPSVFLAPAGNDAAPCTEAQPCQTLQRGYRAAGPGEVVELAGGSYAGGPIAHDSAKVGGENVIMRPAAGASVSVTSKIEIYAEDLEIRSLSTGGWETFSSARDVTLRDIDAGYMSIKSSRTVRVIGGSVGPGVDYHPTIVGFGTTRPPQDILIDGVDFHDWTRSSVSVHTECLQIAAGDGVVVRNSTFRNCHATGNIHVTNYGDSPITRNVTIEGNFLSKTVDTFDPDGFSFYSIQAHAYPGLKIRYNSALQGFVLFKEGGAFQDVEVVGNVAPKPSWACESGVKYAHNVWYSEGGAPPAKCDATDLPLATSNPGFANPSALDLHLTAGSPAIGRGAPNDHPARDIDGQGRPQGGAVDAGADER